MPSLIDVARNFGLGAIPGALMGGGIGAIGGLSDEASSGKKRLKHMGQGALAGALSGGLLGGIGGAVGGTSTGRQTNWRDRERAWDSEYSRSRAGSGQRGPWENARWTPKGAVHPQEVDWLKGVKTKADAKRAYRAQAQTHHPDRAASEAERLVREETMKKINATWDAVQQHPSFQKFAFTQGIRAACAAFGLSFEG